MFRHTAPFCTPRYQFINPWGNVFLMANTNEPVTVPDAEHVARIEAARDAMSRASRNRYLARRSEVEAERNRLRAVGMHDRYAIANVARRHGITAAALRNVIKKGAERWPDDFEQ